MILGLVTLNALLAQSSFRIDELEQKVTALKQENVELTHEQAALSAPGRIAAWARRHGMRLPDEIQFLHVSKAGPTAPAGETDESPRVEQELDRLPGTDG
jgi:cell division protein FtsL